MLVAIDIDGTIVHTPAVQGGDYAAREACIASEWHAPVDGAREGVARLLALGLRPCLLTARSERLRERTRVWVNQVLPELRGAPLSMRALGDLRPSVLTKWDRLHALRGDGPVVLVDDDAAMRIACDLFLHAPECWALDLGKVGAWIEARRAA